MRLYDISIGIEEGMPVWPGDPEVVLERFRSIGEGGDSNVSRMEISVHVGTHVDAPLHLIDGAPSVDALSLKSLIGRAYVVHLRDAKVLDSPTLEAAGIPPRTRRVLFKTSNSKHWSRGKKTFQKDFVAVHPDGAEWLVRKGVQLVGVDYLSVGPYDDGAPTHRILLEAGVVVVEGLDLSEVSQGRYTLYCLPLKLIGSDGAPARAILIGV